MRRFAPLIVFAALIVVLLWPVLLGGRILLPGGVESWSASDSQAEDVHRDTPAWDAIARCYPARVLLGRAIRSGELPLWNPHQMCGAPFLADGRNAVLYPPNLLFAILPPEWALGLLAALHLFAAGAFTYVFLRGLNISPAASTFGGVAFMLSSFAVVRLELPEFLSAGVWLPLALHFSRLAHERQSAIHAAGAGAAVALAVVGGQPQIALYCALAVGLYWLYLGVSIRSLGAAWGWLWLVGLTFGMSFALAAPQLFPSAEIAAVSRRAGGYAAFSAPAMPVRDLIALFVPDFFSSQANEGAGIRIAGEYFGYVGILTLILMPLAFGGKGKYRGQAWFFGGLAVLALLIAVGTGINRLLYPGIPGLTCSGSPAQALFLFALSAAVLGSIGLDRVMNGAREKRLPAVLMVAVSALGVSAVGLALLRLNLPGSFALGKWFDMLQVFPVFLVTGVLLLAPMAGGRLSRELGGVLAVAILAADLIVFGIGLNPTCERWEVYPSTRLTELLKGEEDISRIVSFSVHPDSCLRESVFLPNSATVCGLFDVRGCGASPQVRCKELLDAARAGNQALMEDGGTAFARSLASPVYDLLGVRWVVSDRPMGGGCRKIGACRVYRNPDPLPRAFIVHTIEFADDKEVLRRLAAAEADPRRILLARPRDGLRLRPWWIGGLSATCKPAKAERVSIVRYTCNTVELKVSAAPYAFLVLTDQHSPGWQVFVDGKAAPIVRADYAFRALAVPPGEHTVEFVYSPRSFAMGLRYVKIACVVLIGLVICSIAGWWGNRGR